MKTANSHVNWTVMVYPWSPSFIESSSAGSDLLGRGTDTHPSAGLALDPVQIKKGITYMSFQRNKSFHNNMLRISMKGPIDKSILIGNWAVLFSDTDLNSSGDENLKAEADILKVSKTRIPRFIGQIADVETSYEKDGMGKIEKRTIISIDEWSHVFNLAVKFDEAVIVYDLEHQDAASTSLDLLQKTKSLDGNQMAELSKKLLNPFTFTHLVLSLIGGISDKHLLAQSGIKGIQLPILALRLPVVPKKLMDDLGIGGNEALSGLIKSGKLPKLNTESDADPFANGFSSTITGVLKKSLHNDGKWSGIFDSGEIEKMATGELYKNEPAGRPATTGLIPIISQGASAWEMMQNTCDSDFNEVFTDILYEKNGDQITGKPVLWVRDKPFAPRVLYSKNKSLSSTGEWSIYDDLPRMYIPEVYIEKLAFSSSKRNSINYIKIEFSPATNLGDFRGVLSTLNGTIRNRQSEMLRFGGHEMFARTNYVSQDLFNSSKVPASFTGSAPSWFLQLRDILDIWWGEYYKMPPAVMVIKDYSVPISIGLNVTWKSGDVDLVAHVTGTTTTITVDATGKQSTETIINLDRVMKVKSDANGLIPSVPGLPSLPGNSNDLDFVEPEVIQNLYGEQPPKEDKGDLISGLSSLKGTFA